MHFLILAIPVFIVSLICFLIFGRRLGVVAVVVSAGVGGYIFSLISREAVEAYLFIGAMGFLPLLLIVWAGSAAGLRLRRGGPAASAGAAPRGLDYKLLVHLDAEKLAKEGIGGAYQQLLPRLRAFVSRPLEVTDLLADQTLPSSASRSGGDRHVTYSPSAAGDDPESWGRATYAFFQCVNAQLAQAPVRLYAIKAGNDLGGLFLTPAQAESACKALGQREEWPYLPEAQGPWYGRFH
jgi:hypothetical protein